MRTSRKGLEFIAKYETSDGKPNLRAVKSPEQPLQGVKYEIGFGHNSDEHYIVTKDSVITEEFAYKLLEYDVKQAENKINRWIKKNNLILNQHEFDALVSATFNGIPIGTNIGLTKALISDEIDAIKREWRRWVYMTVKGKKVKAGGLVKRREDELHLYLLGDYERNY